MVSSFHLTRQIQYPDAPENAEKEKEEGIAANEPSTECNASQERKWVREGILAPAGQSTMAVPYSNTTVLF